MMIERSESEKTMLRGYVLASHSYFWKFRESQRGRDPIEGGSVSIRSFKVKVCYYFHVVYWDRRQNEQLEAEKDQYKTELQVSL